MIGRGRGKMRGKMRREIRGKSGVLKKFVSDWMSGELEWKMGRILQSQFSNFDF